jgi:hypothetical protein
MSDASRKVAGLGEVNEGTKESITKEMPPALAGVISGKTEAEGFFANLSRSDTPPAGGGEAKPQPARTDTKPAQGTELPPPEKHPDPVIPPPDVVTLPGNCPHCGGNLGQPSDLQPTDQEKHNFIRYVCGMDRFFKDYEFMGGKVKVRMQTRQVRETDAAMAILRDLCNRKVIPDMPISINESYVYNMQRLFVSVCLVSVSFDGAPIRIPAPISSIEEDLEQAIKTRHKELSGSVSDALMAVLLHAQREFDRLVNMMTTRANDSDFYTPTAG